MSNFTIPTLTTLEQPKDELAVEAVSRLIRVLEGKGKNGHLYLQTSLREGGSVGPCHR